MAKLDVHMHLSLNGFKEGPADISPVREMISHMASLGITRGLALSMGEKLGSNEENRKICAMYPDIFHWYCNVDADQDPGTVEGFLREQKELGAVGVGEFIVNERIGESALIQAVFAAAEKLKLPLLFHMSPEQGYSYGIADDPGMPMLEEALQKYSELIIIGHSQTFWIEISGDAPKTKEGRNSWGEGPVVPGGRVPYLLEKYPNLYADMSANSGGQAVMRDRAFGLAFMEKFQDKLLFGTDMVNTDMTFPLAAYLDKCLAEGALSAEAYEKICHKNAEKLFGI